MSETKKVWTSGHNKLRLNYPAVEINKLENVIYGVSVDEYGFYLYKVNDSFEFPFKVYGLESKLISRVVKTYQATSNGNLGVLLNGLKGTGKTMSAKLIANELRQPTILVSNNIVGVQHFLNSIPQNVTIFIDEYEKVFEESNAMLTIMDGMMNSDFRRVFLLTTNELYIDKNLLQRPGRIRYLKTFDGLEPKVIEEIIDDVLEYSNFKQDLVTFISTLQTITVDVVKAVINEVNIHNESPSEFESVFNVQKLTGKYDVSYKGQDGHFHSLAESVVLYPKPIYTDSRIGNQFTVDGRAMGKITKVINYSTIEVTLYDKNSPNGLGEEKVIFNVESSEMVNYAYAYDGYGSSQVKPKDRTLSEVGEKLFKALDGSNGNQSFGPEFDDLPFDEAVSTPSVTSFHVSKILYNDNGCTGDVIGG